MANVAAHLVDRVLPAVPVRQWVLSLPFELRALAAFRADVLAALVRIFVEAVDRRHGEWAKRVGIGDAPTGAVTHVRRFGSSVNLNVHFRVMVHRSRCSAEPCAFSAAIPTPTRTRLPARPHRRGAREPREPSSATDSTSTRASPSRPTTTSDASA
jgi:hypothetical protein